MTSHLHHSSHARRAAVRFVASVSPLLFAVAITACGDSHEPGDDGGGVADGGGRDGGGRDGGGSGGFDVCATSDECVVIPASCCGRCGAATREDIVAVNSAHATDYAMTVCEPMEGCPACFAVQDPTLVATCNAGRCEVVDIRVDPSSACTTSADCRLRSHDCCECGGDIGEGGIIAIRADAESAYTAIVCDPTAACADCAPIYPAEATATCDTTTGHCDVLWAGGT